MTAAGFGFSLLWLGGVSWISPLLVFFGSSTLLSKVLRTAKKQELAVKERGDIRNSAQVLANGGVAWVVLFLHTWWPQEFWYVGFVGALAAANADTWATEIGRIAGGRPRHILSGEPLAIGASGGVTWQGTAGSLAGALLVSIASVPFCDISIFMCLFIGCMAGIVGSISDSLLGATLQALYRDESAGVYTESAQPGVSITLVKGWRWVNNDIVNVFCTFVGSVTGILFYALM